MTAVNIDAKCSIELNYSVTSYPQYSYLRDIKTFQYSTENSLKRKGYSPDELRHPRSDAYSAQQVLMNKQQIWCGGVYLDQWRINHCAMAWGPTLKGPLTSLHFWHGGR